jgi:aromatic amino acid aminotransferase I
MSLWEDLAEHHVLIVPGTIFSAASVGQDLVDQDLVDQDPLVTADGDGFFRISFSSATPDEMHRACKMLATRVRVFFKG